MSSTIPLCCACGTIRGTAHEVSPATITHVVCYCDDCQAYARFLGKEGVLDASGGTEIFQTAQSRIELGGDTSALRCLRLSPKGLYRWYAGCCRTPIGNTLGARVPFVGVLDGFIANEFDRNARDHALGPATPTWGKFATGPVAPEAHRLPLGLIARAVRNNLVWWIAERNAASPFYDPHTHAPRATPEVLSPDERARLSCA